MYKRTSFQKELNGEFAELFLDVRDYIKIVIGNSVKEKQNSTNTSYKIKEGSICSLKVVDDTVVIIWLKADKIDDIYTIFDNQKTKQKIQKIENLDSKTRQMIRYYVQQSYIYLIEYHALKENKKGLKI